MNHNSIAVITYLTRFRGECNALIIRYHQNYQTLTKGGHRRCASTATTTSQSNKFDFTSNGPCKVLEWAAIPKNRHVALKCLEVPSTNINTNCMKFISWEDYWKKRGWDLPKQLKDDTEREHGKALATHVMTAPMTILSMIDQLLKSCTTTDESNNNNEGDIVTTTNVRWCCLGARSEASLPTKYWQEMIDLIHVHRLCSGNISPNSLLLITIDFIGPEMNILPDITIQQSSTLLQGTNHHLDIYDKSSSTHCTIRWQYKGFYHTYYDEMREKQTMNECIYDAYVLFNPGVGHKHLTKSWQPTLQVLRDQYHTAANRNVTMLFTAHSKIDAQRDNRLLQQFFSVSNYWMGSNDTNTIRDKNNIITKDSNDSVQSNEPFLYIENPFASRIYYHDPIVQEKQEGPHIVRPNHFIALFSKP